MYVFFIFSEASTPMNQRQLPSSFWQIPQQNVNGSNNGSTSTTTSLPVTSSYADFYTDSLQQAAALQLAADYSYHSQTSGYMNHRSTSHPYNSYTRLHQQATAAGSNWAAAYARFGQVKGEWAAAGEYQAAAALAAAQGASGLHNATAASDFSHHYGAAATAHHYANISTGKYLICVKP